MKKVISVLACAALAACACDENQWEEVDNVTFDETVYIEPLETETTVKETVVSTPAPVAAPVYVEPKPVYVQAPQPIYDCPCAEVKTAPCGTMVATPACGCSAPAPQPKVTTSKKIITTTTTVKEPCGKDVCEPVVTTHEEIIPAEVSYSGTETPSTAVVIAPKAAEAVSVVVETNPYRASEVVSMNKSSAKIGAAAVAKYSPEVYVVVATRAANRMLQDTSAIYDSGKTKTLYIKDTKLLSSDLPYGSHRLKGATKDIIAGSKTYDVVNSANNADFVIETSADWYVAPNNNVPALQYKLSMFDKAGRKINEWVEIIRQVEE